MEIRQLRYFVRTCETGSISRAASDLSIVQSALSYQIHQLENEVGIRLLVRSSKGVSPTAAGQAFYRHALSILQQVEQAKAVSRKTSELQLTGTVSIGLPSTTASMLGLSLLKGIQARQPGLAL